MFAADLAVFGSFDYRKMHRFLIDLPVKLRHLNRFAREARPYLPSEDLKERFDRICEELFGEPANEKVLQTELNDPVIKFKVRTFRFGHTHFNSE